MNPMPPDPLSPEERALAERLKRLGPHGGPAASLDAAILAAARAAPPPAAAASRRRRRGWGARLALPATLVTAIGTAAAFALVIGVAWQLRPMQAPAPARGDAPPGDDGFVAAEIVRQVPAAPVAPPPPPPPAESPAPRTASRARVARSAPPPASPVRGEAAAPVARRAAIAALPTIHQDMVTDAGRVSADAAPGPAAAPAPQVAAVAASVPPAPTPRPVREDFALPPDAWLQRIRERRDGGDLHGARTSLRRFRREHPRVHVPSDLQSLAR